MDDSQMDFWYNKIKCDHCGQTFSSDGIQITILLYGIFFLVGKEDDYIGTTCPSCLQTIYNKVDRQYLAQAVEEFSSIVSIGDSHITEPLRYFSPFTTKPAFNTLLKEYDIMSNGPPLTDNGSLNDVDQVIYKTESEDPDLAENYYRSYTYRLPATIGSFFNVLWIQKDQVEDVIKLEQKKNVRIFPRYIHRCSLLDLTDKFSWQHCLAEKYYQSREESNREALALLEELEMSPKKFGVSHRSIEFSIPSSDKSTLETLKKIGMSLEYEEEDTEFTSMMKERGISLNEKDIQKLQTFIVTDKKTLALLKENGILPEEYELSYSGLVSCTIEQNKKWQEEDFSLTSIFQKILIEDLKLGEIPFSISKKGQGFWKIKHPFAKMDLPSSIDELNAINAIPPERDQEHQKQIDCTKKYFHKGYAQEYLNEHYLDFIKEYIALIQEPSFAYANLWALKNKHLARYYDHVVTKRCEEADYAIIKEGKAWKIIFNGRVSSGFTKKGFKYIQYLVNRPGEMFTTDELAKLDPVPEGQVQANDDYDENSEEAKESGEHDVRNLTNKETIGEYKDRLQELHSERLRAEQVDNQSKIREINQETEYIKKELSKLSWKGKSRKDDKNNSKRNKQRIAKSIELAVKALKPKKANSMDQEAFDHFSAALKPINSYNQCYNPTEKYNWKLNI